MLIFYHKVESQTVYTKENNGFALELNKDLSTTEVKNQGYSSTCWSYSTESFIESELIRMGKGKIDLSEMYVIRMSYFEKAVNYIRREGKTSFNPGGEHSDVLYCIQKYGIVPESIYQGNVEQQFPNHHELDAVLKAFVKSIISIENEPLSTHWKDALNGILDAYFGQVPSRFTYEGKEYTPLEYATSIGIIPSDYVLITSFTHHPFYTKFILEVEDNWLNESYINVPLQVLEQCIDHAIENGYTVAWSSDITEKGFSYKNGLAIIPEKEWSEMDAKEKENVFTSPIKQKIITPEFRQEAFDNLSTQDDHAMHIVGIAYDKLGQKYYKVKNSWGDYSNDLAGYFFASASFVEFKTTSICLHKDALSKEVLNQINKVSK